MEGSHLPDAGEAIAHWLKDQLDTPGWSRKRLGAAINPQSPESGERKVYRWLGGQTPRGDELMRLASIFGVEPPGMPMAESLADQIAGLREDVRRLERAFRELSQSREDRYDALVAGQEAVVEAVTRVARELQDQDGPSGSATSGTPPAPNRRRRAS